MDNLEWKVKTTTRRGPNYHEEAQAQIDPWSLAVSRRHLCGWRLTAGVP